jgi:transposase
MKKPAQHLIAEVPRRQWGLHLAARGGKQAKSKAVVAVARKLAVLLHHLWSTQEPYVPFYEQAA